MNELRDEIAAALHRHACDDPCQGLCVDDADAVLPVMQRHIDAAREQVAEQIAQALVEAANDHERLIADIAGSTTRRVTGTSTGLRRAADIARQHGKAQP